MAFMAEERQAMAMERSDATATEADAAPAAQTSRACALKVAGSVIVMALAAGALAAAMAHASPRPALRADSVVMLQGDAPDIKTGIGCSNWRDIRIGAATASSAQDCAKLCVSKEGCVAVGFQHLPKEQCTPADEGVDKDACYLYEGTCNEEKNACWTLSEVSRMTSLGAPMVTESPAEPAATMDGGAAATPGLGQALQQHQYSLIFDAGSSGTRLRIYRQIDLEEIEPSEGDEECFKGEILSDFAGDPCGSAAMVQRMLKCAEPYITPASELPITPVWLRGTAGVRMLAPDDADGVFDCLNKEMEKPGATAFLWQNAQIASGDMEAVFGSITVNHMFGQQDDYVGSLDMGGASAQIAFRPEGQVLNYEFVFYNESRPVHIYAKSYSRYGQDQGLLRSYELLVELAEKRGDLLGATGAITIDHPCLLSGYKEDAVVDDISATFVGTGEYLECASLAEKLMLKDVDCMMPPCAMIGTYQTKLHGKFFAYSGYYYLAKALGLMTGSETVITPGQIADALPGFCGKSYEQLEKERPDAIKYDKYSCFRGWFAYSMLKAMHFTDDDTSITFTKGGEWTLGALIYYTQLTPSR